MKNVEKLILEKSRKALPNLSSISTSTSTSTHDLHLINLANVENLFLVDVQFRRYSWSYGPEEEERGGWEWGSRDMMLDLGDDDDATSSQQQRMAILTAAANVAGGALHLLDCFLTLVEERALVEALSLSLSRSSRSPCGTQQPPLPDKFIQGCSCSAEGPQEKQTPPPSFPSVYGDER